MSYNIYMEHFSVVGIATSYGLDGSGLGFRKGQEMFSFPHPSIPALGPAQPP